MFTRSVGSFNHQTPFNTSTIWPACKVGIPHFGCRKYKLRGAGSSLRNAPLMSPTHTFHFLANTTCSARMMEVGASVAISTLPRSGSCCPATHSLALAFSGTSLFNFLLAWFLSLYRKRKREFKIRSGATVLMTCSLSSKGSAHDPVRHHSHY